MMLNKIVNIISNKTPSVNHLLIVSLVFNLAVSGKADILPFIISHIYSPGTSFESLYISFTALVSTVGLVLGIPIGILIDRKNTILILFLGLLGFVVSSTLLLFSFPYFAWLGNSFVAAIYALQDLTTIAVLTSIIVHLMLICEPQNRTSLLGLHTGIIILSEFVGRYIKSMLFNYNTADEFTWYAFFQPIPIIGCIALVLLLRTTMISQKQYPLPIVNHNITSSKSFEHIFLLLIPILLFTSFETYSYHLLSQKVSDDLSYSIHILSAQFVSIGIAEIIGCFGVVILSQKFKIRNTTTLTLLLIASILYIIGNMEINTPFWLYIGTCVLFGVFTGIATPLLYALVIESTPAKQWGLAMSLTVIAPKFSVLWWPFLYNLNTTTFTLSTMFTATAIAYLLVACLLYIFPYHKKDKIYQCSNDVA